MNIKELRKRTKLSQSQFAKRYSIPLRTLQKWEQGAAVPLPYLVNFIDEDIKIREFIDVNKYLITPKSYFEVMNQVHFRNAEKVHPIMQRDVQKIVDSLSAHVEVKKIIIFGSAITYRCTYDSDIDIYVELAKDKNVKAYNVETPVDYWTNYSVDPKMLEEIINKGVTIYDCH